MARNNLLTVVLKRAFLILMLGGIFYLSHQPSLKVIPPLFQHQDKVLHAGLFFLLFISMIVNRELCRGFHPIPVIFVFGLIYAAGDEIHQSFVPGRDCSAGDFIADIAGLAAGLALYLLYCRMYSCDDRFERKQSPESS